MGAYDELKEQIQKAMAAGQIDRVPSREQRIDFAYGNTKIENEAVTREMCARAVDVSDKLSRPMLEALAVLHDGSAERTTGPSVNQPGRRLVNRQAVLALCRRDLAKSIGRRTFEITIGGIAAFSRSNHSADGS